MSCLGASLFFLFPQLVSFFLFFFSRFCFCSCALSMHTPIPTPPFFFSFSEPSIVYLRHHPSITVSNKYMHSSSIPIPITHAHTHTYYEYHPTSHSFLVSWFFFPFFLVSELELAQLAPVAPLANFPLCSQFEVGHPFLFSTGQFFSFDYLFSWGRGL